MRSRVSRIVGLLACLGLAVACDDKEGAETDDTAGEGGSSSETGGEWFCEDPDAKIPGDCRCVDPGEPCAQGCFERDGMKTCAQVCAELGESCAENECGDGWTYIGGSATSCPIPSEYGLTEPLGCDEPVPILEGPEPEPTAACCCT